VDAEPRLRREINANVANGARMYDYMLGGKDNFAADRELADRLIAAQPGALASVRANRAFLKRAVRYVTEAGIRQFIDIGSGLPTMENTHEIAQRAAPDARVVYVDNDPTVIVHGRAMLADIGPTAVADADVRRPEAILRHSEVRRLIDFDRPVAFLLLGILHYVTDQEDPYRIVARFREAMAPGSYLVVTHYTGDDNPHEVDGSIKMVRKSPASTVPVARTRDQIERFFDHLEILDPGIVPVHQWRSDRPYSLDQRFYLWAGVGRAGVGRSTASS
jgi:O-methyltransferase involved in polyketide biosynthesis